METIEFKKECIDIVNLLGSRVAVGEYRGDEVWTEIETLMDSVSDGILVLIDLRQAIWLNTAFCKPAFGPIFQTLKKHKWSRKYIIFQMYDSDKPGFFQGVLKYFKIDVPRKDSESEFTSANMYAKLIVGDEELINFIGKLDRNEQAILRVVNELGETTAQEVEEKCGLGTETVVHILRSLAEEYYFIVEHSDESGKKYHYYSFYEYLRKE